MSNCFLKVYPSKPVERSSKFHQIVPLLVANFNKGDWVESISESNVLIVANPDDAQVLILCQFINEFIDTNTLIIVEKFINSVKNFNKPIWIFSHGDYDFKLPWNFVYHFRNSVARKRSVFDISMPYFNSDPIDTNNLIFYTLNYTENPSIGFCGQSNFDLLQIGKRTIYRVYEIARSWFSKKYSYRIYDFYVTPFNRFLDLKKRLKK